jgi:putative phosphoribosyl transferase
MIKHAVYRDRHDAGRQLAERLAHYRDQPNVLVLALPRGGVAVAYEVAEALRVPLDVFVVRKLGFPGHEEYAMGAITTGGVRVMNPMPGMRVSPEALAKVVAREELELARREQLYRAQRPPISVAGRTVILVDDGLATGATMRAAALAIRQQRPGRLVLAVPVGAASSVAELAGEADEIVVPAQPEPFFAVSLWYEHMPQASDDEVRTLLDRAWTSHAAWLKSQQAAQPAGASLPATEGGH